MSGSYTKNLSGGVLRKNISSITDEIDPYTGQLTGVNGIIKTLDTFRIVDFNYGDHDYNINCGWITTAPLSEGHCRMWGNPIGEMMYETLRYFSGAADPTDAFTYSGDYDNANDGGTPLALPKPAWIDPYDEDGADDTFGTADDGFAYCAKPFMLVLSDINPTYDSDALPGSYSEFGSQPAEVIGAVANDALDVATMADTIGTVEGESGDFFLGQVGDKL